MWWGFRVKHISRRLVFILKSALCIQTNMLEKVLLLTSFVSSVRSMIAEQTFMMRSCRPWDWSPSNNYSRNPHNQPQFCQSSALFGCFSEVKHDLFPMSPYLRSAAGTQMYWIQEVNNSIWFGWTSSLITGGLYDCFHKKLDYPAKLFFGLGTTLLRRSVMRGPQIFIKPRKWISTLKQI